MQFYFKKYIKVHLVGVKTLISKNARWTQNKILSDYFIFLIYCVSLSDFLWKN
jgi:hypothetical protein